MLKGNKGEWSEIYTLLKLLSEGKLFTGDAELNKIQDLVYPIIKILRSETEGNYEYSFSGNLVIITSENQRIEIPIIKFAEQTEILLQKIKTSKDGAFTIPEIEFFLTQIRCKTLRAKSSVKTDIKIVIHDLKTNTQPNLGFSIESQLGSPATLLNASKATNFVYKLNAKLNNIEIEQFNEQKNFVDKFKILTKNGIKLEFIDPESSIFKNNLILIDSLLPEIIAEILILSSTSNNTKVAELTEEVSMLNPMNYDLTHHHNFYDYKIKHLLTDIALGLMPSKVWTGIYDATGGYLVVKDDGVILAYHIYNKNEFENFLFENTRLIRASTSRHEFGKIFIDENEQKLKLNLQIRFNK